MNLIFYTHNCEHILIKIFHSHYRDLLAYSFCFAKAPAGYCLFRSPQPAIGGSMLCCRVIGSWHAHSWIKYAYDAYLGSLIDTFHTYTDRLWSRQRMPICTTDNGQRRKTSPKMSWKAHDSWHSVIVINHKWRTLPVRWASAVVRRAWVFCFLHAQHATVG